MNKWKLKNENFTISLLKKILMGDIKWSKDRWLKTTHPVNCDGHHGPHNSGPYVIFSTNQDSKYLKIRFTDQVKWPLANKYNLKYHLAQKNIELKVSFLDDKSVNSDWLICRWGFDEFFSDFGPIRDRIELPAAITNLVFLGSINHITTANIRDLNIKYIISGKVP